MDHPFPSDEWLEEFIQVLNNDQRYAEIAKSWEGGLTFIIETDENSEITMAHFFLDLWHGKCRKAETYDFSQEDTGQPRWFNLRSPRKNFMKILSGELDPMQAMLTRRLKVEGDMAYLLRNVPTVLQFVRCAQKVGIIN